MILSKKKNAREEAISAVALIGASMTVDAAEEAEPLGILVATSGPYTEKIFAVYAKGALIGRSRKCRISLLHDCEVSHNHAAIGLGENGLASGLCIRDVGSTFGTYLNDKRLSGPKRWSDARKLKPSDSIKVCALMRGLW